MTRNYPYHTRSFIKRAIKIRQRLIEKGYSKHDHKTMHNCIQNLDKKLGFFPFNTRKQMAAFVIRYSPDILYIMPGEKSKSHQRLFSRFQEIYEEALSIQHEEKKSVLI